MTRHGHEQEIGGGSVERAPRQVRASAAQDAPQTTSPGSAVIAGACTAAAEVVASAPLPPGWRLLSDGSGIALYLNEATGTTQACNPAETVLQELLGVVRYHLSARACEDERLQVAVQHMVDVRNRAQEDMRGWSGPHFSSEAGAHFYHNASRGISVWHHPAAEWEADLQLRRQLLCHLLHIPPHRAQGMAFGFADAPAHSSNDTGAQGAVAVEVNAVSGNSSSSAAVPARSGGSSVENHSLARKKVKGRATRSPIPNQGDMSHEANSAATSRAKLLRFLREARRRILLFRDGLQLECLGGKTAYKCWACWSSCAPLVLSLWGRCHSVQCGSRFPVVFILAGVNFLLLATNMRALHRGNGDGDSDGASTAARAAIESDGQYKQAVGKGSWPDAQPHADAPEGLWQDRRRPSELAATAWEAATGTVHHAAPWSGSRSTVGNAPSAPSPPRPPKASAAPQASSALPFSAAAIVTPQIAPRAQNAASKAVHEAAQRTTEPPVPRSVPGSSPKAAPPSAGEQLSPIAPMLFPLVQRMEVDGRSVVDLHKEVEVTMPEDLKVASSLLSRAASRAQATLRRLRQQRTDDLESVPNASDSSSSSLWSVSVVRITMSSGLPVDETLDENAKWSYSLLCEPVQDAGGAPGAGMCSIEADGVFGAVAALGSTLTQLFASDGRARFRRLYIRDWPTYPVRGLMIDTGRRFVPKDILMKQVIDGMALVRMNLLHLHLSDFCRFAIDLPSFPELNHSLGANDDAVLAGQYSLEDVREIVDYARDRGISVLPEVDLPGHASGLLGLEQRGLVFCRPGPGTKPRPEETAKVRDDPSGSSRGILRELIATTAKAFGPDLRWFHVGGDEANPVPSPGCTKENIVEIEAFVVRDVVRAELGLTAIAWEELRLKKPDRDGLRAAGDTTDTIVMPWRFGTAHEVLKKGHRAVVANMKHHYLDYDYRAHPIANFWYDVAAEREERLEQEAKWPSCSAPSWEKRAGRFLGGYVGHVTKSYKLAEAQALCANARGACAGVTCQWSPNGGEPRDCQMRRGKPYLEESITEDSWIKRCPQTTQEDSHVKDGLLGGISAMWTDKYCYIYQCGAADPKWGEESGRLPNAGLMFPRVFDASFGLSLAGMIWPRAAVSAAALWRYTPEIDTPALLQRSSWLSAFLRSFGVASCPSGCACDELTSCGKSYPVLRGGERFRVEECFFAGSRAMMGAVFPGQENGRPMEDALELCFWMGERCAGASCSGEPASGSNTFCQLHMPSTLQGGLSIGSSLATVFLLKDVSSILCAPYLAWSGS